MPALPWPERQVSSSMPARMDWPYELQIGWRYTRAGRSGRRNRFISFISAASMAGIALGVAALIIVLSVMNGFRKEVRDRMLSVVSHVEVGMNGGERERRRHVHQRYCQFLSSFGFAGSAVMFSTVQW